MNGSAEIVERQDSGRSIPWSFLCCILALAGVAALWWYGGSYTTLPAWQIAVLPAAGIGWITAWPARKWSPALVVMLVLAATVSACLGEWFRFSQELLKDAQNVRQGMKSKIDASLLGTAIPLLEEKLTNHLANELLSSQNDSKRPFIIPALESPRIDEQVPLREKLRPFERPSFRLYVYYKTIQSHWVNLSLSLLFSWFGAFLAARISLSPPGRGLG